MLPSPADRHAAPRHTELETAITGVEARLDELAEAMRLNEAGLMETRSQELHRALMRAVDTARRSAAAGRMPVALRRRLALATGQVAAQREAMARASAALDRAFDVLIPSSDHPLYSATGGHDAARAGGRLEA